MSSTRAPRIDSMAGVTKKAPRAKAPAARLPFPSGFHCVAGRIRSASRSRMSRRTALVPIRRKPPIITMRSSQPGPASNEVRP